MKAFFVLKPDAVQRPEVLKAYEQIINSQEYVKNRNQYLIDSWVDLSCKLYEPINVNKTKRGYRTCQKNFQKTLIHSLTHSTTTYQRFMNYMVRSQLRQNL